MKIIFKSLYAGSSHIHFESSIIQLYMHLYPEADFIFIGNKKQVENVLNLVVGGFKVKKVVSISESPKKLSYFYFVNTLFFRREIIRVDLSGILPNYFYFFGALQDHIYQHQLFTSTRFLSRIISLLNFNLTFLLNIFFNLKIITLGPWIQNNYRKNIYFLYIKKYIYQFKHPYLFSKPIDYNNLLNSRPVFGFLGSQKARHKSLSPQRFQNIKSLILNFNGKILLTGDEYISEDDYMESLCRIDYSVILYLDNYKYACSCVFIESLVYKKPIICLSSDMADHFFDKYGDIGFKCDSINELEVCIKNIILHPDPLHYSKMVKNLQQAAHEFTDQNELSKTLSNIL